MKSLGICIGASTISLVQLSASGAGEPAPRVADHALYPHDGDPRRTLSKALSGLNLDEFDRIAATGRRFRQYVNLSQISETEAVEHAYRFVKPDGVDCPAIVSAGGETFMAYTLNGNGQVSNVVTGNKCASGTGEFFLQQLRRMNVDIRRVSELAVGATPYRLSGRCSVFCKSDCTHATNKGIPVGRVTAGLCRMMAAKVLELLKSVEKKNVMVVGGTVRNRVMVDYLAEEISGLIVPEEAPYFEALGAALWALTRKTAPFPGEADLFRKDAAAFDTLPPLARFEDQVAFKTLKRDKIRPGDKCVLGLDVGSTTTKAVLLRWADNALLASIYLRTNGQPVEASRDCYRHIRDEIAQSVDPADIEIAGLGVCGSGRQIAGLHAMTDGIINEIIAHAEAAVYFDPEVDTLFEIGGQDAKYTYITNGVPSDYAMNEACSAGTGSFLEESARETLSIPMTEIADIALRGERPPNFNDQCAAFISSDIKTAVHDGVAQADIVAGLVYSICMNYNNRVKGNRPVGRKVFMQGGVCYNRAVPLAMASITGKEIIVPPEPGLMGAFGVAIEIKKRIEAGLAPVGRFHLDALIDREVSYGKSFICKGGKEKCDRRCEVAVIRIEGKTYPFGGACNRYYNLRRKIQYDTLSLDLVARRQEMIFGSDPTASDAGPAPTRKIAGTVGLNRSFLVNTYYPLYSTFFRELGFDIVMPDDPSPEGIDYRDAPFCYPAELAHGFFHRLLTGTKGQRDRGTEGMGYLFLPHFKAVPDMNGGNHAQVCPIVQGETYYLRTAFGKEIDALGKRGTQLLSPVMDLTGGLETAKKPLMETAHRMGIDRRTASTAVDMAVSRQADIFRRMKALGRDVLAVLEKSPDESAVVVFGRPYNGFAEEAHMGIPRKLASRGVRVIPMDFLPIEDEEVGYNMYWGLGQMILKATRFVRRHPQLFGLYITNFSCGPDSFVIGYFRNLMGRKPALILELDSHTADAGLETRIEAFLDVVAAYRQQRAVDSGQWIVDSESNKRPISHKPQTTSHDPLPTAHCPLPTTHSFTPAQTTLRNGRPAVITSAGETIPMADPRVRVLIPSMGRYSSEALAAVFRSEGIDARALPPADEAALKLGRANTTCKECLPLQLTTGGLLHYLKNAAPPDRVVVYFMATASGPCRFGQYRTFMEELIKKQEIPDAALFSLSGEDAYSGMRSDFTNRGWWAVIVSDVIEDIRSMILANAKDPQNGLAVLEGVWNDLLFELEYGAYPDLEAALQRSADRLAAIPQKLPPEEVPVIGLTGEIFVRRDSLSRRHLTEELAEKGFAVTCAPVAEWLHYCDFLYQHGFCPSQASIPELPGFLLKKMFMARYERRIKSILSASGLVHAAPLDVESILDNARPYIQPHLTCETILTVGSALTEIVSHVCGVIAIGPFGCMPNRLAEALLTKTMVKEAKLRTDPKNDQLRATLSGFEDLPFLAIETDGSPFPQLINAKLETFCLRADRLHQEMRMARFN